MGVARRLCGVAGRLVLLGHLEEVKRYYPACALLLVTALQSPLLGAKSRRLTLSMNPYAKSLISLKVAGLGAKFEDVERYSRA